MTASEGKQVSDGGWRATARGWSPSAIGHLRSFWLVAAFFGCSTQARGQYLTRPHIPWRTISTESFDIHFPAEMETWTRVVASQMEAVAGAVHSVAGNRPSSRVTVLVEDPSSVANGFALPFLEGPVIFLWPTPPSPSATFGAHRGWGEALAVHEYGHIAHLTFASRNPGERRFWKYMPVRIGPVTRKSPAWVIEGYATLIEGQLTGSGRPFSSGRAAVLRQWALEGAFPTYAQLNGSGNFLGGNMRYLAGSAFLEWLQQRRGDSSLVHLWRRMSARVDRSFGEAFAGVFGAGPAELYGAFTVDVMERALDVRTRLRVAGVVEGELVQRLTGGTGEPAVSPDGSRLAIVVRSLTGPSRLVVIATQAEPDSALRRSRARVLERDSLDVLPFDSFPRPRRAVSTLRPFHGRSHEQPRWMPDGVHVLVTRDEPVAGGVTRPDLFSWNTKTGDVRRLTRNAAIRQADPAPDGRSAVAVRCHAGACGIVRIDLGTGTWRELVAGTPELVWHRPRFSPDGARIAASYHEGGRWNVALIGAATGTVTRLTSDEAVSRYAPAFTPDGRSLVVVSDRGGIPNLELVPVDGGPPQALTRVTGAVAGPDVSRADSSVWFLTLRSGGYDLRRAGSPYDRVPGELVSIGGPLAPVAPPSPPLTGVLARGGPSPLAVKGYGLGPRRWRLLPGGTAGPDGHATTLMVSNIDPIARLNIVAQGTYGTRGAWRGASAVAGLRRTRVAIDAGAWYVEHEPTRSRDRLAWPTTDVRYSGGGLQARLTGQGSSTSWLLRTTASAGHVRNAGLAARRIALSAEARGGVARALGGLSFSAVSGVFGETGVTAGESWRRAVVSTVIAVNTSRYGLRGEWLLGRVTQPTSVPGRPPTVRKGRAFEQFVLGGAINPLMDQAFLSQRIPLPPVPAGFLSASTPQLFRASLTGGLLEPFFAAVNGGRGLDDLRRIAGLERSFATSSLGFARLPAVRARAGAAYSFDSPFARRLRAYASLIYSP